MSVFHIFSICLKDLGRLPGRVGGLALLLASGLLWVCCGCAFAEPDLGSHDCCGSKSSDSHSSQGSHDCDADCGRQIPLLSPRQQAEIALAPDLQSLEPLANINRTCQWPVLNTGVQILESADAVFTAVLLSNTKRARAPPVLG